MHSLVLVKKVDIYLLGKNVYPSIYPLHCFHCLSGFCCTFHAGGLKVVGTGAHVSLVYLAASGFDYREHSISSGRKSACVWKEEQRYLWGAGATGLTLFCVAGRRGGARGQDLQHLRTPNAHERRPGGQQLHPAGAAGGAAHGGWRAGAGGVRPIGCVGGCLP